MPGDFFITKLSTCVTNLFFYLGLTPDMTVVQHIQYTKLRLADQYTIAAMMAVESGFDLKAESSQGAKGILQLMPIAVQHVQERNSMCVPVKFDYFNQQHNIQVGACYMQELLNQYQGSEYLMLAAYNGGGISAKSLHSLRNLNTETANYIAKVKYLRDEVCLYAPRYQKPY